MKDKSFQKKETDKAKDKNKK